MLKGFIPPVLQSLRSRMDAESKLYYFGEFNTFEDAMKESERLGGNYENSSILEQVNDSTQRVRKGEALYEQDGICFYEENNNYELLAAILYAKAFVTEPKLEVIDFGGGLGSTYFRYRNYLDPIINRWQVVEQRHYVDKGKETVPELEFKYTIEECILENSHPNLLLLSSVLQYLDKPYEMFRNMLSYGIPYIVIDETVFLTDKNVGDKIMLQHVPESIYKAVYPVWLFSLPHFREFIRSARYEIIWEWEYKEGFIPIKAPFGFRDTIDKGFLLRIIK